MHGSTLCTEHGVCFYILAISKAVKFFVRKVQILFNDQVDVFNQSDLKGGICNEKSQLIRNSIGVSPSHIPSICTKDDADKRLGWNFRITKIWG